jgi:triacylglycerol lipase
VPQFSALFAHDVLLPIAEAAYLPALAADSLPAGYAVVGPITVSPLRFAALAAENLQSTAPHLALMQAIRQSGDTFGWVLENLQEHTVVAAFRGTASAADWLHDLDFLAAGYEPVKDFGAVHQGFQAVYKLLRESLFAQMHRSTQNFTRLIVTGHSLGAALSELAAPDLLRNGGFACVPEVQNFAGPRVGHSDFARNFNAQIPGCFRIVNNWDIVPHLPPPLALFEHVGVAARLDCGFTLDARLAHSLEKSYAEGLTKLLHRVTLQAGPGTESLRNELLIGREP